MTVQNPRYDDPWANFPGGNPFPYTWGPDAKFADFLVQRDTVNPRVIQASGIDSPGLTSSLAIGDRVAKIWRKEL